MLDRLSETLRKYDLEKIEYKNNGVTIKITRSNRQCCRSTNGVETLYTALHDQADEIASSSSAQQNNPTLIKRDFSEHAGAFKSPIIGTCYLAPEPGAENFIAVGAEVQEGRPMFIIEAMKVMNLIKAPRAGRVIHIAVSNAAPVEYGQLLAVIE
jgi:acetyl-CoA carboxylase biotin carboxyl carrier protein